MFAAYNPPPLEAALTCSQNTRRIFMKLHKFFAWLIPALLLTFAAAAELRAESPLTFSGYLRIRNYVAGGFFGDSTRGGREKLSEHYAVNRLRVSIVFKPNDNVEVRWRFHAPHGTRWGVASDQQTFRTMYAFGVLKTGFGNFSIGRISTDIDSAGLQTLGYVPTWGMGSQGYIFDHDTERDGMMYRKDWDNGFGLKVFYAKMNHFPQSNPNLLVRDADYDRYSVEPYYKWENGGVSLALQYDRNNYPGNTTTPAANHPAKNYYWSLNPAFLHSFSLGQDLNLIIHAEAKYSSGKYQLRENTPKEKQTGFGAYLDFTLAYPQGTAALAGWWFDGDKETQAANGTWSTPARRHTLVHPGQGFYPFVLFYRNHAIPQGTLGTFTGLEQPNHWAVALMGNHKFTDNISMNYGVATFNRTKGSERFDGESVSKHLGTEFDVGLVFKIFDSVQFSTKLGVMPVGSYYKQHDNRDDYDGTPWVWGNELIFNF
jgi:hypothetical protein